MEEADILGDRIAIIHSGRMRCYGTSMFLKKLYGALKRSLQMERGEKKKQATLIE